MKSDIQEAINKIVSDSEQNGRMRTAFVLKTLYELKEDYKPFILPSEKTLITIALKFNKGDVEYQKIQDMLEMCKYVIDNLYKNGCLKDE